MLSDLMQLTGGLGLFLLGMGVMTDGLHRLADDGTAQSRTLPLPKHCVRQ
jgi:hypothetical protein